MDERQSEGWGVEVDKAEAGLIHEDDLEIEAELGREPSPH